MKFLVILLFIPGWLFCQTSGNLWIDLGVKGKITERLSWDGEITNRFGPNGIERFYIQGGVKYKLTKWFRPSIDYRFSFDRDDYTNYQPSHRIMLNGNFEKDLNKRWAAEVRLRYQYDFSSFNRDYGYQQAVEHTLRLKPEISYNIKDNPFTLNIGSELFYSLERYNNYFYKVRLFIGTDVKLDDPMKIGIKYVFDHELFSQNNYPKIRHAIALSFKYTIQ